MPGAETLAQEASSSSGTRRNSSSCVTSWVRADRAELDVPLAEAVWAWLEAAWPFERVVYLGRATPSR